MKMKDDKKKSKSRVRIHTKRTRTNYCQFENKLLFETGNLIHSFDRLSPLISFIPYSHI